MFTKDEIVYRACQVLVKNFKNQVEENRLGAHTRIFNYFLHPETDFVHYGTSVNITDNTKTHQEHVVPCGVLIDEIFRLIEERKLTDNEIAQLLQKHWKIVTITKDEANRLDSTLGLKSNMPSGWKFENSDTFARLKKADIKILQNKEFTVSKIY